MRRWWMGSIVVALFLASSPVSAAPQGDFLKKTLELRKSVVKIRFFLKKDKERGGAELMMYPFGQEISMLIGEKQSLDLSGFVIDSSGMILGPDFLLPEKFVDHVAYQTVDGATGTATFAGMLRRSSLSLYRPDVGSANLVPLETSKAGKTSLSTDLYGVRVWRDHERWQMGFGQLSPYVALEGDQGAYIVRPRDDEAAGVGDPLLILSEKKRVVGFSGVPARLDPDEKTTVWKAENIFSGNIIDASELEQRKNTVREWVDRFVYEVKIVYRLDSSGGSDYSSSYDLDYGSGTSGRELRTCGLAVASDLMFVPTALFREEAERIESIFVTVDGEEVTGAFAGAFKEFTGFLLKPEEGSFPRFVEPPGTEKIEEVVPLFAVNVEQRFGGREVRILLNRGVGYEKAYRNRLRFKTVQVLPFGSYLLDLEGRLIGFVLMERREGEEDGTSHQRSRWISAAMEAMEMDLSMMEDKSSVFSAAEIREAILDRGNLLDPTIIVKTKDEAKRRPWLGVEFTSINKDLAKMFKCEEVTRDGRRGILVSYVYAGSPAERIGIREGDILLSIQDLDEEYPVDLEAQDRYDYLAEYAFEDDEDAHSEAPLGSAWRLPPWRNRGNYLTTLLQGIGVEKPVELVYWQNGEKKTATFDIEQAPRDFESAEKYKDEEIGLTVKDITYEVRRALQLEGDSPGVIVAKVEPGSPAAVAKIRVYDVIREIDQVPIADVKSFESLVAATKKEGRETIRLLIFDKGKLRFANLGVSPVAP